MFKRSRQGLLLFVAGVVCLIVWGVNTEANAGWMLPGIVLAVGGLLGWFIYSRLGR